MENSRLTSTIIKSQSWLHYTETLKSETCSNDKFYIRKYFPYVAIRNFRTFRTMKIKNSLKKVDIISSTS